MSDADEIDTLPYDKSVAPTEDMEMLSKLFKEGKTNSSQFKDPLIAAVLYIIMSIPQIDKLVIKLVPVVNMYPYTLIIVKALLVMFLFWLIKHFHLSRKE